MNEKISKIRNEEFINHHAIIEYGTYTYAIFEALALAESDLEDKRETQNDHPENYDSSHIRWQDATVRELKIGESYKPNATFRHGIDDGHHGSTEREIPQAQLPIKANLIVNV